MSFTVSENRTMHSRWNNGWRMTVEQAKAALNLAPADDQMSAVEPNRTRRDVVQSWFAVLRRFKPHVIDVSPSVAHNIACVVQDCTDPVELRFAYDPGNLISGGPQITVGWNREEVEIRKGLRPRPGVPQRFTDEQNLIAAAHQRSLLQGDTDLEQYLRKELAAQQAQFHASSQQQNYMARLQAQMGEEQRRLHEERLRNLMLGTPAIALTPQQLQELIAADSNGRLAQSAPKLAEAKPAAPPVPEPKLDPSSPKFVLKRPKLT